MTYAATDVEIAFRHKVLVKILIMSNMISVSNQTNIQVNNDRRLEAIYTRYNFVHGGNNNNINNILSNEQRVPTHH
mgnify:CR=1 FL=1